MTQRRIAIPMYARDAAQQGLELRRQYAGEKPGLTDAEARRTRIRSGVRSALIISRSKTLSIERAKAAARFYLRFRNCATERCEIALLLWGGRRWGKELAEQFYG